MCVCVQAAGGGAGGGWLHHPQGLHRGDVPPHHVQLGGVHRQSQNILPRALDQILETICKIFFL